MADINFPKQQLSYKSKGKEWRESHLKWANNKSYYNDAYTRSTVRNKKINYDLINVKKGLKGEQKTLESLKAITVSYPILNNVRLEEDIKNSSEKYSAETDLIIVTDRAIFLVETKNYGGKGDTLIITTDGRWILRDKYDKKEKTIKSPFKQTTDHIFVINKFYDFV